MQIKTLPGNLQGGYPVFVMDEMIINKTGFHPEFNFIVIQQKPHGSFYEFLKQIPNPILLCLTHQNEDLFLPELIEQIELHNIKAAIIDCRVFDETEEELLLVRLAEKSGPNLLKRKIHGIWAVAPLIANPARVNQICFGLLQAAGLRITKSEFISCPTCSRTSFDLVSVVKQVKELAGHLPGIKIAIMGCVVNGPGEMADADFGILGATQGKVHIYHGNKPVLRNIEQGIAAKELVKLIEQNLEAVGRKNILP